MIEPKAVLRALAQGKGNGIHMRDLAAQLYGLYAGDHEQRKTREMIVELRDEGHPICGTPDTGYFLAATTAELDETCEFLLSRVQTTVHQIAKMKHCAVPNLRGQLGLPLLELVSDTPEQEAINA